MQAQKAILFRNEQQFTLIKVEKSVDKMDIESLCNLFGPDTIKIITEDSLYAGNESMDGNGEHFTTRENLSDLEWEDVEL